MWFNQSKWIFLSIDSVTFRLNDGTLDKCKLGCIDVFEEYLSRRLALCQGGEPLNREQDVLLDSVQGTLLDAIST